MNKQASPKGLALAVIFLALVFPLLQACQPMGLLFRLQQPTAPPTFTLHPTNTSTSTPTATTTDPPSPTFTTTHTSTPSLTPTQTPTPEPPALVFAAIGDYGCGTADAGEVAELVDSWKPEFVITVGDNNYPVGAAAVIDDHIGQFYHQYIFPYQGSFGVGADINRFFPSLGNHDTLTDQGQAYLDYFTLPGNERYYDFVWGPVHLFAVDNDYTEPDGITADSTQGKWLQKGLAASTSPWNIVYLHLAPYSSSWHGSNPYAQWPYKEWGADAVLAGHDHAYERLDVDGLTYIVNGDGGCGRYNWNSIEAGSQVRYNNDYGALRVEVKSNRLLFQFINRAREVVDEVTLQK